MATATANLKEVLAELTKKPGVIAACVASRDGFVIEGLTSEEEFDMDALGAFTSSALIGPGFRTNSTTPFCSRGMRTFRQAAFWVTYAALVATVTP